MEAAESTLPYLSADLPGIGGRLRSSIGDFQVEEIPSYPPCGEGDHVFAWIEKRKVTTAHAIREIASALDINERDVGAAGMKDKFAVTRQMLSLPPPVTPEAAMAIKLEGVQVLSATRHGNKLRTGHLRGNRFLLRVRELDCSVEEAQTRARAILQRLSKTPGAPNWYGAQRFGKAKNNAQVGKALVTREKMTGKAPRGRQRRLYISAYQSKLFNDFLQNRMQDKLFHRVVPGDVLQKRESGGMFVSENVEEEQARFDEGQLSLTGPMFGHKMKCPEPQSEADAREQRLLEAEQVSLESFSHLGKLANGTRRPLSILLGGAEAQAMEDCLEVRFTLPSGSYATAIMRELMKGKEDFPE